LLVNAYVLLRTEVGMAGLVAQGCAQVPGVLKADTVIGPYDVIVLAEARSVDELGKLVVARIQTVGGHHPDSHLSSREGLELQ
jgi:hypothetical protein